MHPSSFTGDRLPLGQKVAKLPVVDLDAIIEVQGDLLVRVVAELLIEARQFRLFFLRSSSSFSSFLRAEEVPAVSTSSPEVFDSGVQFALQRRNIRTAHPGEGGLIVAVQIDQAFERFVFAAGKEPVDRPSLVGLEVVFEEARAEITADGFDGSFAPFGR